jgi:hypothetical protein
VSSWAAIANTPVSMTGAVMCCLRNSRSHIIGKREKRNDGEKRREKEWEGEERKETIHIDIDTDHRRESTVR